jgi:hypothetical protein
LNFHSIATGTGLWETVGLAKHKKRIPKIGDHVSAVGRKGAFIISSVDSNTESAELKQIGRDLAYSSRIRLAYSVCSPRLL